MLTQPVRSRSLGPRLLRLGLDALAWGLALAWLSFIVWALVASLRPAAEPLGRGDVWFGSTLTLENYRRAWALAPFARYYLNTVLLVLSILGVQVITITLAAFAFAHTRFPGQRLVLFFVLLQLMIPTTALLAPNFATIRRLGLFDTILAIGIPYYGSAFGTFLMRQAFLEVPQDLVDAGIVDGCSWWQLLRHVYLPPSIPTLVAFALSSVAFHWNEFLWPLVVTVSDRSRPLTVGLVRFTQLGEIGARWSLLTAATLLVAAPLLVAFLVFQRRFIQSFLYSGLK